MDVNGYPFSRGQIAARAHTHSCTEVMRGFVEIDRCGRSLGIIWDLRRIEREVTDEFCDGIKNRDREKEKERNS